MPHDEQAEPARNLAGGLTGQARRTPGRIAVSARDGALTYAELDERSTRLAHRLVALGVTPEQTVALFTGRTTALAVGVAGILKAGAAYLPVSPEYPGERTRELITAGGTTVVITTAELLAEAGSRADLGGLRTVVTDDTAAPAADSPLPRRTPSSLAYVLPTSGSTGAPKGVLIEDRNVLRLVDALHERELGPLGPALRISMVAPYVFDASVQQLFGALLLGHTLVIVPEQTRADGHALREFWALEAIDVSDGTPAHLRMTARATGAPEITVRHLIVGGDVLTREVVRRFHAVCAGHTTVTNIYGVAECAVDSVSGPAEPFGDDDRIPIGTALPGSTVELVDSATGRPAPDGETGEIRISGSGVGRGYLGHDQLTADRFGVLPGSGDRFYRTGDLARRLPDGRLMFLGRSDRQVKLRGLRIEPAEIEVALRGYRRTAAAQTVRAVSCQRCLLTSAYPGVTVVDGVCDVCRRYDGYRDEAARYFGGTSELVSLIRQRTTRESSGYDVLLLFSGGKDSSYALYRLIDLGFRVLAFTFDNGFISQAAFDNIERITANAGVDFEIGTLPEMNSVFVESLRADSTVCGGCFRGLTAMSTALAVEKGIGVVATGLSRGQIFDTKLRRLFEAQIRDPGEIDQRLVSHRKVYHARRDRVAKLIALPIVERSLDDVLFLDYFRYDDVDTAGVREFLKERDPLWAQPTDTGMCSTNCRINEVGIYVHSIERGYHNYASPLSWDCRLGVLTREQGLRELAETVPREQIDGILTTLGYTPDAGRSPVRDAAVVLRTATNGEPYLCAYYAASEEIDPAALREHLTGWLPAYMVPARFRWLAELPATAIGKVDYRALAVLPEEGPEPGSGARPRGATEERLAAIWADVLGAGQIDRDADFFLLGGDSLMATIVAGLVQGEFGVPLSATDLFAVPTIEQATILIEAAGPRAAISGRTPRASGADAGGLVLLPDVLGGADMYGELTGRLSGGVSALTGRSLFGDRATELSIEELAAEYTGRVTGDDRDGGVRLGGWSFGGTLAFEVARQLEAAGRRVAGVAVIDAAPPEAGYWGAELRAAEEFLGSADDRTPVPAAVRQLLPASARPDHSALVTYAKAVIPVLRALARYVPAGGIAAPLICVRAAESGLPATAEDGWRRLAGAGFHHARLPGDHFSILEPPRVNKLARLLNQRFFATQRPEVAA